MKYNIITIERKFASGGRQVGKILSDKLGIPCYGKEILEITAKKYSVSIDTLEELEEKSTSSFLYSVYMMAKISSGESASLTNEGALFIAESKVIADLASKGACIIIGHCAAHALVSRSDVLNVFIQSNQKIRLERAINDYEIDADKAESLLKKYDRRRSNYYNSNTGLTWNDSRNYHMVLDSGKLGLEGCAGAIAGAFTK